MSEKQTAAPMKQRLLEIILQSLTGAAALGGGFAFLMAFRMAAFSSFRDATAFSLVLFLLAAPCALLVVAFARVIAGLLGLKGFSPSRSGSATAWFVPLAALGGLVTIVMLQPFSSSNMAHLLILVLWVVVAAVLSILMARPNRTVRWQLSLGVMVLFLLLPGLVTTFSAPSHPDFDVDSVTRLEREGHEVFLIGLDGATFDVIDKLVAQGDLPNLARLMERGSRSTLMSEMAPNMPFANSASQGMRTPVIWETIISGTRPSDHKVWDFYQTKLPFLEKPIPFRLPFPGSIAGLLGAQDKPVYSTDAMERRAWELFDDFNEDSVVVGWVDTWPAFEMNHCSLVGDRAHFDTRGNAWPTDLELQHSWYHRDFAQVAKDKLDKVFVPNFREVFEEEPDGMLAQEDILNEIMQGGLQNEWYREGLYRKTAQDVFGFDFHPNYEEEFEKTDAEYWEHHLVANESADLARDNFYADVAVELLQERKAQKKELPGLSCFYFPSTDTAQHWLWKYYEPEQFPGVDAGSVERLAEAIPNVYRNADRIVGQLLAMADEDTTIIIVSDHGGGAWLEQGNAPSGSGDPSHEGYSGNHRPNGILIAAGPGIKQGFQAEDTDIYDVLPLVLHVSGLPIADNMPGEVPTSILSEGFLSEFPVRRFAGYGARVLPEGILAMLREGGSGNGDQAYMDRLAELGYADGQEEDEAESSED